MSEKRKRIKEQRTNQDASRNKKKRKSKEGRAKVQRKTVKC